MLIFVLEEIDLFSFTVGDPLFLNTPYFVMFPLF